MCTCATFDRRDHKLKRVVMKTDITSLTFHHKCNYLEPVFSFLFLSFGMSSKPSRKIYTCCHIPTILLHTQARTIRIYLCSSQTDRQTDTRTNIQTYTNRVGTYKATTLQTCLNFPAFPFVMAITQKTTAKPGWKLVWNIYVYFFFF